MPSIQAQDNLISAIPKTVRFWTFDTYHQPTGMLELLLGAVLIFGMALPMIGLKH